MVISGNSRQLMPRHKTKQKIILTVQFSHNIFRKSFMSHRQLSPYPSHLSSRKHLAIKDIAFPMESRDNDRKTKNNNNNNKIPNPHKKSPVICKILSRRSVSESSERGGFCITLKTTEVSRTL